MSLSSSHTQCPPRLVLYAALGSFCWVLCAVCVPSKQVTLAVTHAPYPFLCLVSQEGLTCVL